VSERHATNRSAWARILPRLLPFADAASDDLPLGRLLRLALFQVSVGIALVLLNGTLNRVMIIEMGIPAALVAAVVSIPLLFAPFRALIGFRSDHHRSELGWRRVPYIWMGTLLQFGGLAIMPFALLVMSEPHPNAPPYIGEAGAALAFLLVGVGLHTTQTAGLALATDLSPVETRPRVVALFYVMLLVGMVGSALALGWLLNDFTQVRLIQVIQGSAAITLVLNMVALWKQEARRPDQTRGSAERPPFAEAWREFTAGGRASRLLVAVGLGTAGFSMQDILLEPYGGEVLHLSVAATTALTALLAGGTLLGFAWAARGLSRGWDAHLLAAVGAVIGVFSFAAVIFAEPLGSALLFRGGTFGIGTGGGLFAVGTLTAAMSLASCGKSGLALGAWGAVQATAAGGGIAIGGVLRDTISGLAVHGALGPALTGPGAGYSVVYHLEIALLFATLVAIGPLVRHLGGDRNQAPSRFGLAEMPG
jgi:BCD family chlorophyll transporter-like MFS transporter